MTQTTISAYRLAFFAGIGMFLSTLDSGIINIAIPNLLASFHSEISSVILTVTLYTLFLSASILFFGQLADGIGRLKIYVYGLWVFGISSALCGASITIWQLILFRCFQGLGAAMMQATAIALITTRLQGEQLSKAMGLLGMVIPLGPLMGPVVGGTLISTLSWRWIFWINIPICALGIYGCYKKLPPFKEALQPVPINYLNMILLGASIFSVLLLMHFISVGDRDYLTLMALLSVVLMGFYSFLELKSDNPIIQFSLFKDLTFGAPIVGVIAFGGATAVAFMLTPLYLEKLKGFHSWQVGLISLSAPLGIVVTAKFASTVMQAIGSLKAMLYGTFVMLIALFALTQLSLEWPISLFVLLLVTYGAGVGLFQMPSYANLTSQFPSHKQSFIASLTRMLQNMAVALEVAGAAMIISFQSTDSGQHLLQGIRHSWLMAALISLIAFLCLLPLTIKSNNAHKS